jgi:hypothetical protein
LNTRQSTPRAGPAPGVPRPSPSPSHCAAGGLPPARSASRPAGSESARAAGFDQHGAEARRRTPPQCGRTPAAAWLRPGGGGGGAGQRRRRRPRPKRAFSVRPGALRRSALLTVRASVTRAGRGRGQGDVWARARGCAGRMWVQPPRRWGSLGDSKSCEMEFLEPRYMTVKDGISNGCSTPSAPRFGSPPRPSLTPLRDTESDCLPLHPLVIERTTPVDCVSNARGRCGGRDVARAEGRSKALDLMIPRMFLIFPRRNIDRQRVVLVKSGFPESKQSQSVRPRDQNTPPEIHAILRGVEVRR